MRHRLAQGEPLDTDDRKSTTFKEFMDGWFQTYVKNNNKHSEIVSKEMILRVHLLPYFGSSNLDNVRGFEIEKYKAQKADAGLHPKTINNHLAVLRKGFQCAEEWGILEKSPRIKSLKTPPVKYDYLAPDEARRLISAADGVWQDMIVIALATGLRFGELIALSWDDIDLPKSELTVRQAFAKGVLGSPKNNRTRQIPMIGAVREILRNKKRKAGFVLSGATSGPLKQIASLKKLHRICRKAGLREIGWHCLRHTFASRLAQAGANLIAIQNLLGHSDIRTTMRYAHINDAVLRETIDILDADDGTRGPDLKCHNSVTMPISGTKTSQSTEDAYSHILANTNEKKAEALLSNL